MIPNLLIPRIFKWFGLALYILTICYTTIYFKDDFDNVTNPVGLIIQIAVFVGLMLMISSKLIIEDEMTQLIRLVSLQWSILIYIVFRLGFKIAAFYYKDRCILPKFQINFLLQLYIILFYFQIYGIHFLKKIIQPKNEK